MKKLYLIRHGESEANVDPQVYLKKNDFEVALTDRGVTQALECADKLIKQLRANPVIFYSPFKRAKDTAEIIAQNLELGDISCSLIEEPLIFERAWGEELSHIVDNTDFDRKKYFSFYYRAPGGESFSDAYQRVVLFFQELHRIKDELPDDIVIVSHGEIMRCMIMYLNKYSILHFVEHRTNPKNCEILEFNL